ncbi:MAG: NAD(P)H-hydrate dehydratase [Terriglobia bacterium]
MKILTAEQMRRIDRLTVERTGISNRDLMENAGRQVADFLLHQFPSPGRISVLCGKGNNGGDALVAARHLLTRGHKPHVALLADLAALKGDAPANYKAFLQAGGTVEALPDTTDWNKRQPAALDCDVLVDGILGTGLTRPVEGYLQQVIRAVNSLRGRYRVLAVDIPSGLPSDSGEPLGEAIQADATLTFTAPKRGQVFPPNSTRIGTLAVAPIGTPEEIISAHPELNLNLVVARRFRELSFARVPASHKGTFGHVVLVGGSRGKTGAVALAGKAALRMGAGLATVATPAGCLATVASLVPELMTEPLAETESGSISTRALDYGRFAKILEGKAVAALGPGLTTHPDTTQFVHAVLEQFDLPLVLDADALNALVGHLDVLRRRRAKLVVITPHPGEMARLLGTTSAEVQRQRLEVAQKFAREFRVFVILKGYRTVIAAPEGQMWVNPTGNPGMATGGAGDVLTGFVGGALAPEGAAPVIDRLLLAVFLHGLAGDLAAEEKGQQALIASDITEALPQAWGALREKIKRDDPGSYYVVP